MVAVVYMRIFLQESVPDPEEADPSAQPMLKGESDHIDRDNTKPVKQGQIFKRMPSIRDLVSLMRTR